MGGIEQCPACLAEDTWDRGALPVYPFAGKIPITWEPGRLFRCNKCMLQFRHPSPPQHILEAHYRVAPQTLWVYSERPEWAYVRSWIDRHAPSRRILDVGCFRGDFLDWLGTEWERYGIEPNEAARALACERGIYFVAESLWNMTAGTPYWGAITCLDVLEHFLNPYEVLKTAKNQLASRGILIVYTGTTDAWAWKIMGAEYWYCCFPEHLSFVNEDWIRWAGGQLGMTVIESLRISHRSEGPIARFQDGCRVVLHQMTKTLRRLRIPEPLLTRTPLLGRAARWSNPPPCWNLRDHLLVALRNDE